LRKLARARSRRVRLQVLAWPAFRKSAANPQSALLARELAALDVDVIDWTPLRALSRPRHLWHLHYPETVVYRRSSTASTFEAVAFLALLWLARLRGVRIVWTVHDLGGNDGLHPRLERWFWKCFIPACDGFICLSERGRAMALERFPALRGRPAYTVPHGHYRNVYPGTATREDARRRLDLPRDATVLLHFGLMRPYKNVPHLVRTFRELTDPGCILLVAGKPYDEPLANEVRRSADRCPRVRLLLDWIPPAEVGHLFAASDLVVLPYRRILNSGVTALALSMGRPVLAPDKGAMRDQRERFGGDWVRLYEGELSARELRDAIAWATDTVRIAPPDVADLDWQSLARKTHAAYEEVLLAATSTT
jgi:beta-1,4-mannosyltransferase